MNMISWDLYMDIHVQSSPPLVVLLLARQILLLVLVEAEVAFHVDLLDLALDLELVLDLDQTDVVFFPAAPLSSW